MECCSALRIVPRIDCRGATVRRKVSKSKSTTQGRKRQSKKSAAPTRRVSKRPVLSGQAEQPPHEGFRPSDISDRKVVEEAWRMETERLQVALRGTSITVFHQGSDLCYKWVHNPIGMHDVSESIGKRDSQLLERKEDWKMIERIKSEVLRTGVSYQGEMTLSIGGDLRHYQMKIDPQRDAQGRIAGIIGAMHDLTECKGLQLALSASEARYRELAERLRPELPARTIELEKRNAELTRTAENVKTLCVRLLQLWDAERRRIAREMRDGSGKMLTAIGLDLATLAEQAGRGEGARQSAPDFLRQVEETHQLVRMLHQELRLTSYLLHPPLLDEVGLSSALRWYAKGVAQRSGIAIDFQISDDFGRLSRALELTLFRVVQESLTNIHRHSGSKRAAIRMSRDAGIIALQVEDSGKGIPPEQLAAVQSGASGFGIRAMRERLRPFGGQLEITSNGGGTEVQVKIPQASLPEWSRSNRCWP